MALDTCRYRVHALAMDRHNNRQQSRNIRLVLVTPEVQDAGRFAPDLAAACAAADLAAVILRLATPDDAEQLAHIRTLAPGVQDTGAALLLDARVELAVAGGPDGVHVSGTEAVRAARTVLKQNQIVGAGGLTSRHDAMIAGELGADYVLFGELAADRRPSLSALVERVAWWSELFEIPCVAYAVHADEIPSLAAAGADFVALGEEAIWRAPGGPAAALTAARQLAATEPAQ